MTSPTPSLPAAIREMTGQEQNDLDKTENGRPREPEPSQDAKVCAAYWVARQMLDGPVDGFSREAWHDALGDLVDALHGAATHPESNPVLLWAADTVVAAYHEIGPNCRAFAQAIEDLDTAVRAANPDEQQHAPGCAAFLAWDEPNACDCASLTPPEDTTPHA